MSVLRVTCPSGLVGDVRKLKTRELNLLSTAKERRADALDEVLRAVWVETVEAGPAYAGLEDFVWGKALAGDRLYAMLQARSHTFGDDFDFRMTCEVCREAYEWTVQLSELAVQALSAKDAETFAAGNRFRESVDGVVFTFQLMTGETEKQARKILKSNRGKPVTAGLLSRILEIEGVKDRSAFLDDLDFDVVNNMRLAMEAHDCGVETTFDTVCSECQAVNEVVLPFGEKAFWLPKRRTSRASS